VVTGGPAGPLRTYIERTWGAYATDTAREQTGSSVTLKERKELDMKRKILIPLAAASLLLATSVASAQMFGGRGGHGGGRGGPVTVDIYSADPANGGAPIASLSLDRPLSPSEVVANYEGAAFVVVTGDSFSRTVELAELEVQVQIYADDPAAGAEALVDTTLVDMRGVRDLVADTEDAAFVVVTGSDFSRTIDLSEMRAAAERFGERRGDGERDGSGGRFDGRRGPGGPGGAGPRGN
jgi:hypothetical protein